MPKTPNTPLKYHRLCMFILLLLGAIYTLASLPLCPQGAPSHPSVLFSQKTSAPLQVGAAKAEIYVPHWPATVAGYGPPRANAMAQTLPLYARAIALTTDNFALSLLSVDILLVSQALVDTLRQKLGGEVLLVPTHSHSSLGGVDGRWQMQVAAMGRFKEASFQAVLHACLEAVEAARQNRQPAHFAWEETTLEAWTQPRSGKQVDRRLLRLRWEGLGEAGEGAPIAQLLLLSAHPTLVKAKATQLNPDYPGELALLEENIGRGLTLVWPSAVGNARISLPNATPQSFAQTLHHLLQAWPPPANKGAPPNEEATPPVEVHHARIRFALPPVDLSRLVPKALQGPATNLLCQGIAPEAELSLLRLGGLSLLAVPFEVSAEAALAWEQAGLGRSVSIANDYLGYVETSANVEAQAGESSLQYFSKTLLERILEAAQLQAKP
ncbi:MAG: neutral/alkaline non-lysosomal ceramidase N-terminal domain-containing protein [Proteobacteria bacterium]|nr:neutral/alkaline non-lysosomal ceramidase N-terminal domain-containing protein [Cystobacterineae bacterium]MCL2313738.1 neutral/alkaline non-lysosomal ceramidase N-terminal domain-containing protein [Pseudomonadota bacterium]